MKQEPEDQSIKQSIIAALLFFSLVANLFLGSVIIMQDDIIVQREYDLNVLNMAFKMQSNQIAKGLCLPILEIK